MLNITNVTIPDNVKRIGDSAFKGMASLREIHFGSDLETIGKWAFYGCQHLRTVRLPNRLTTLERGVFYYCPNLEELYIPNSVTEIEMRAAGWEFFDSKPTIVCSDDSYAHEHAISYGLNYIILHT